MYDESLSNVALNFNLRRCSEGAEAMLDMRSSGALNKVTSETVKKCLPHGTRKPFPKNCLSLMTQSGAKGSMVNFSQIAACLVGWCRLTASKDDVKAPVLPALQTRIF
jgi:hypothetical protein